MSEEESLGRNRGREELREKDTVGTWDGNIYIYIYICILMKEIFIKKIIKNII